MSRSATAEQSAMVSTIGKNVSGWARMQLAICLPSLGEDSTESSHFGLGDRRRPLLEQQQQAGEWLGDA